MKKIEQLCVAEIIGTRAYHDGLSLHEAQCEANCFLMDGRKIGETPDGEATSVAIMRAVMIGWVSQSAKNMMSL